MSDLFWLSRAQLRGWWNRSRWGTGTFPRLIPGVGVRWDPKARFSLLFPLPSVGVSIGARSQGR
jgi:hypothetical protein